MAKIIDDLKGKVADIKDAKDEGEKKNPASENGEGTENDGKEKKPSKVKGALKKFGGYFIAAGLGAATVIGAIALGGKKLENEDEQEPEPEETEEA